MSRVSVFHASKSHRQFGEQSQNILDDLSLSVYRGTIYVLVGASGCGKTTLINCLLGIQKLDSGEIKVFGRPVIYQNPSSLSTIIGYMPQQIALAQKLTVFETLQYFAGLHLIDDRTFKIRLAMLADLLYLPPMNAIVGNLSGGEQRRVSFAVTVLHKPSFIVLDEPTVGLDCELRDRIWKYLHQQSREENVTVLFTTQYWSEVTKAHRCGFLRNGSMIIEGSPDEILDQVCAETIDEAFYKVCLLPNARIERHVDEEDEIPEPLEQNRGGLVRMQVLKTLLIKEFNRLKRSRSEIYMIYFALIINVYIHFKCIGDFPKDLRIGILNYETTECASYGSNQSLTPEECFSEMLSCKFLGRIDEVVKIPYQSRQQVHADFLKGKIFGYIKIDSNFSQIIVECHHCLDVIEVFFDSSRFFCFNFAMDKFRPAIFTLIEDLSKVCGTRDPLFANLLRFNELWSHSVSIFSKESQVVVTAQISTWIILMLQSVYAIHNSRSEGSWNRSLLSGLQIGEVICACLVQCLFTSLIISLEAILTIAFVLQIEIVGSVWLVCAIFMLMGVDGCLFGLFASIAFDSFAAMSLFTIGMFLASVPLSGLMQPLENSSEVFQHMAKFFPITLPGNALREIVFDGVTISHRSVLLAFLSLGAYTLVTLIVYLLIFKRRKFA